ncbi:MAG: winged helix-turn-helix transcriptional regulator [Novosphingobium sp.]|nr:winged helix-turn-helix transcriptional regulator [Novosphingobium sp.]
MRDRFLDEQATLVKDRAPPRYLQLAGELRRKVLAGNFAGTFPTEAELCQHYNVSRFTVREALRRLASRGPDRAPPGFGHHGATGRRAWWRAAPTHIERGRIAAICQRFAHPL